MSPLHHRTPPLAALISPTSSSIPNSTSLNAKPNPNPPYYSIIADGHHVHPSMVSLLYHANAEKCILVTDSVELTGLDDGVYGGHAQVEGRQVKQGSRVVKEGTETLIGGCASLQGTFFHSLPMSEARGFREYLVFAMARRCAAS